MWLFWVGSTSTASATHNEEYNVLFESSKLSWTCKVYDMSHTIHWEIHVEHQLHFKKVLYCKYRVCVNGVKYVIYAYLTQNLQSIKVIQHPAGEQNNLHQLSDNSSDRTFWLFPFSSFLVATKKTKFNMGHLKISPWKRSTWVPSFSGSNTPVASSAGVLVTDLLFVWPL